MELPPADASLLFKAGELPEASGRFAYNAFCKELERTGEWGSRFYGLDDVEKDARVQGLLKEFSQNVRRARAAKSGREKPERERQRERERERESII